ncbi:MAG: 3-deoxy-manno-octulosonate cytidylyltransferase [Campylobacterales bacterium]|nr:3-deoxy-manno-octulosonate cytidylyltransferase [Campylobacterales bacterium]
MIIIPARIGSSRFPNKILADVDGIPMVVRTALRAKDVDKVCVATDSNEVIAICKSFEINAILTSINHNSGTDRIYEAAKKLQLKDTTLIINVQADEPFLEQEIIQTVHALTKENVNNPNILINSCYKEIDSSHADDPNIVKVVTDKNDMALYFSRSKIPYSRDHFLDQYKAHIGIYGFTMQSLHLFANIPNVALEDIEKLEQLRALFAGYKIAMKKVETNSFGIDTPDDLERALKLHRL